MPSYLSANVRSFTNEFTNVLNIAKTHSKFVNMCGDYNIEFLKIPTIGEISLFYKNIIAIGLAYHCPEELCDTMGSLIGNVYLNVIN